MTKEEFQVALEFFRDCNELIAAGKIQRWEIVKWTVTVNLSFATASIAIKGHELFFFLLPTFITIISALLINHYNRRMHGARERLAAIIEYLQVNGINPSEMTQVNEAVKKTFIYDNTELWLFPIIGAISAVPSLYIWVIRVSN